MNGSRMIRVRKRDGSVEALDPPRLTAAIWRAMKGRVGGEKEDPSGYGVARNLSQAVVLHLARTNQLLVSSEMLFRMLMKVLRKVNMENAASALATSRLWRSAGRQSLVIIHGPDKATLWDKAWLAQHASRSWNLGRRTSRIVAAMVEEQLLTNGELTIDREQVLQRMNECVASLGLADAVPVSNEQPHTMTPPAQEAIDWS